MPYCKVMSTGTVGVVCSICRFFGWLAVQDCLCQLLISALISATSCCVSVSDSYGNGSRDRFVLCVCMKSYNSTSSDAKRLSRAASTNANGEVGKSLSKAWEVDPSFFSSPEQRQ
jgi:hypothetical protein